MKRKLVSVLVCIFICVLIIISATACEKSPANSADIPEGLTKLTIITVDGDSMLLAGDTEVYTLPADGIEIFSDGELLTSESLKPGMVVGLDLGNVQETFPARPSSKEVYILEEGKSIAPLIIQVFDDLRTGDNAVAENTEYIGFDLSKATGLSEGEKSAIMYAFSTKCGYGMNYVGGTFEELCDAGYIDKENLYWENGVLYSFSVISLGDHSVSFNAEEWRSGLGAEMFTDCNGIWTSSGWTYKVGALAVA